MGIIGFLSKEAGEFLSLLMPAPPGPLLVLNLPVFICLRITCQLNLVIVCVIRKQTIRSTRALRYLCACVCKRDRKIDGEQIKHIPVYLVHFALIICRSVHHYHLEFLIKSCYQLARVGGPTPHFSLFPLTEIATSGTAVTFKIAHVQTMSVPL